MAVPKQPEGYPATHMSALTLRLPHSAAGQEALSGISPAIARVLLACLAARLVVKGSQSQGADPLRVAFRCWLPAAAPPCCLACSQPLASAHSPEGVCDEQPPSRRRPWVAAHTDKQKGDPE